MKKILKLFPFALAVIILFVSLFSVAKPANATFVPKITVCHHTSSESNTWVTIEIPLASLFTHLQHGDTVGSCVVVTPTPSATPSEEPSETPEGSPTPTGEATATPESTSTPVSHMACNHSCNTDEDCTKKDVNYRCHYDKKVCRNKDDMGDEQCHPVVASTATPQPTAMTPEELTKLPAGFK